ncbi:MAG: GNAT family N-acetyltransferase [Acutalibacter sp.]|nr:GNAT family N-acetyltransferase [Acutalibacter sp.]
MNVELKEYAPSYEHDMKQDIADFFAFHGGLVGRQAEARTQAEQEAMETLKSWQQGRSALYAVLCEGEYAGFLRLDYRGDQAAWIEDLYVRPDLRGRGIASQAIRRAEGIVSARPGYTAMCMDVAPRNEKALRLYYRLGYDSVSLVTLRREFGENPRDRKTEFLGREFQI